MLNTLDSRTFISHIEPFSSLDEKALDALLSAIDLFYFQEGEEIATKGETPTFYFIIGKGKVEARGGGEEGADSFTLEESDGFDAHSLLQGKYHHSFLAKEESIIFGLQAEVFLKLIKENPAFEKYYLNSLAGKLDLLLQQKSQKESALFMATRIKESQIRRAPIALPTSTLFECAQIMRAQGSDVILVPMDSLGYGIITNTDLRNLVILEGVPSDTPAATLANPKLIKLDEEELLSTALMSLIEHNIQRIIITRGATEEITGILDQVDLLSSLASRGHQANFQIQQAQTLEELQRATSELPVLIKTLQTQGVKTHQILHLLKDLNHKTYKRLFEILMPLEVQENSALILLGSEGRGEQTLRTDQDNALILREGFSPDPSMLKGLMEQLVQSLVTLGFPHCPGDIMVSNPLWCRPLSSYLDDLDIWIAEPTPHHMLQLAILLDATHVAGDKKLTNSLRQKLFQKTLSNSLLYARFALPALQFKTPLSWFSHFITDKRGQEEVLDIKKGALFPLMHGIRTLSLEYACDKTGTLQRIQELREKKVLEESFALELAESFEFLLQLRLELQLQAQEKGSQESSSYLNPSKLKRLERDLLREVLRRTERFKKFLTHHFKLHVVS